MANPEAALILAELESYVLGKGRQLEYALTCILSNGHLLIEDVPGVGKTTLAKSLAWSMDAQFNRIQFTSDLLPSDLIGVTVFHQTRSEFEFRKGPVFTNILLADEINRANPKTQSALLEAMHDAQVSHDGQTFVLPQPFFVVATQNSKDNYGTFPLPESQLDRFLMKINIGYAEEVIEKKVIRGEYQREKSAGKKIGQETLKAWKEEARAVHVSPDILNFMYQIIQASRNHPAIRVGVSTRGGQALYGACQSLAWIRGRDFVIPDDVIELAQPVLGHRMVLRQQGRPGSGTSEDFAGQIIRELLQNIQRPL